VFIAQAAISSSIGRCASDHRALAVGLYATFYYVGGSAGATLPAWAWSMGGWPACVVLVMLAQAATFGIARWFWSVPAWARLRWIWGRMAWRDSWRPEAPRSA